ncbi:hypothetical protein FJTKL_14073 [Diaporthe vaccinii]|uniref:Extracellular membrane protein CFEM domain-containing protein n=1 Tax=Diaporthe vaccinii TaxID=105482 RepID=A0ABR4E900_9PEZI
MISRIHITAFSWLLCFSALVSGQTTVGQLLQQTPTCAVSCFLNVLPDGSCLASVDQLNSCMCSNVTLLTTLSGCTRLACEVPDQIVGENGLGQICRGAPLFVESQATFLMVLAIVAIALAIPSIGLRWYARYKSSTLGVDGYLALLATIALLAVSAVQLASSFIGFGVHVWVVDPRNAIPLLRLYWISQQLYILDQLLTKISLLALYLRVFPKRWINLTARYGIFVMVVQETIFYFLILLRWAYGVYGAYGVATERGAQTIELKSKAPPMGGILHTTTIEVTHERNLSDDELLIAKTRPSVSSAASRRSLQTIDEEHDDSNERGRSKSYNHPIITPARMASQHIQTRKTSSSQSADDPKLCVYSSHAERANISSKTSVHSQNTRRPVPRT